MATRIYCPRCEWKPQAYDRWQCVPSCGTVWNTFETRGRCPGCAKQWQTTQCLSCHVYSLHEAWYHEEELDAADHELEAAQKREELVEVGT